MVDEWKPPGGRMISVCGCNASQVVCAAGPALFYLEVKDGSVVAVADTTLEHEVRMVNFFIILIYIGVWKWYLSHPNSCINWSG